MRPTSASHKIESSRAFLSSPLRLFEKVTCRLVVLSILLINIFPLPIWCILYLAKANFVKSLFFNEILKHQLWYWDLRGSLASGRESMERLWLTERCIGKSERGERSIGQGEIGPGWGFCSIFIFVYFFKGWISIKHKDDLFLILAKKIC